MRASGERGRVFFVGFACLKERCPILIEEHQDLLTDLRWQRLVRFMRLHAAVYLVVVEVLPFMNEGLSYLVQSGVIQGLVLLSTFLIRVSRFSLTDAAEMQQQRFVWGERNSPCRTSGDSLRRYYYH